MEENGAEKAIQAFLDYKHVEMRVTSAHCTYPQLQHNEYYEEVVTVEAIYVTLHILRRYNKAKT